MINISPREAANIDRQVYAAVHGKKVVLTNLLAAGRGWNHNSGTTRIDTYDQWRRGRWTLRVEWSQGGRIMGAALHEDQVDPDTGRIRIRGNGETVRFLRLGMVAGERRKKERLAALLLSPPDKIKDVINEVNAERIADDRAADARRRARG